MIPPLLEKQDAEQLRILAIFHFVFGSLALLGIAFLGLHFLIFSAVFNNPEMWKGPKNGPPPRELFEILKWFYLAAGLFLIVPGVLNVASGLFLLKQRHRTFSLVVAGLDCLQIPLGTLLGVFTIIVLSRDSVRTAYEIAANPYPENDPYRED